MKTLVTFADEGVSEQFVVDTLHVWNTVNPMTQLVCNVSTDREHYLHRWARFNMIPLADWTVFFKESIFHQQHHDDIMMRYEHPEMVIAYPGKLEMNSRVMTTVRNAVMANVQVKIFREEHDPKTWATKFPTVVMSYKEVFE